MMVTLNGLDDLIKDLGKYRDSLRPQIKGADKAAGDWLLMNQVHNTLIELRGQKAGFDAIKALITPLVEDILRTKG